MSRRLSASVGLFKGDRLLKSGDFNLVRKVEVNLYLLPALAAGLIRGKYDNLLDILVHNRLRQPLLILPDAPLLIGAAALEPFLLEFLGILPDILIDGTDTLQHSMAYCFRLSGHF